MVQESRFYDKEDLHLPFHSYDTFLSGLHITAQAAFMQIHTYMFTVCTGGIPETRAVKRAVSHSPQAAPVPPMGWKRI